MSSRALSLATVMFLIGCLAAVQAQAENLDAGKSPSQLFAGTCAECHKSSRGLLRKVPAGSLPGFLRQHYTTSGQMASVLSAYLIANGAADRSKPAADAKPGTDGKPEDAKPADQADRRGRRRLAPGEAPDAAKPVDGQAPAQAATERGPESRSVARSRRGKPGSEEPPKSDAAKTDAAKTDAPDTPKTDAAKDESAKGEPVKDVKPASEVAKGENNKSQASKPEASKSEGTKPSGEGKSGEGKSGEGKSGESKADAAKAESPKASGSGDTPALRADPVPAVTPAPAAAPPAAASSAPPEPAAAPPASAAAPSAPPPVSAPPSASVTASGPPPAPAPAGPPAPPISQ